LTAHGTFLTPKHLDFESPPKDIPCRETPTTRKHWK
jgi:hypothetical protein